MEYYYFDLFPTILGQPIQMHVFKIEHNIGNLTNFF